jgi:hypothetical protein
MQQLVLYSKLIVCSKYFGHHYAHHQELKSIIQVVAVCGVGALVYRLLVWCGAVGYVSGLHQIPQAATTCIILLSS